MTKTIEIRDGYVYYKDNCCGFLVTLAQEEFEMGEDGLYDITITKGKKYEIRDNKNNNYYFYSKGRYGYLYLTRFRFLVCKKSFDKLFFALNCDDRYDIIVEKVGETVKKETFIDRMKRWLKN